VPLSFGSTSVDGILFDLDDVLVPFLTPAAWQWAWRPQGPLLGERRVRAAVRRCLRAWDRRRWRGLTGREPIADVVALQHHLRETLFAIAGHGLPEAEADAVVRRLLHPAGEIERFPDVAPALARLAAAGVRVGVVTPLPAASADWLLRRTGLDPRWLSITGDSPATVPARGAFLAAASGLGVPTDRLAFVGDLFWSDVRAAGRAGLAAVLLDRHDAWPKVTAGRCATLDALEATLAAGPALAGTDEPHDDA
jgi:FMN phosphatase YigB (HAD superfamily)